jgi:hypothetical protein
MFPDQDPWEEAKFLFKLYGTLLAAICVSILATPLLWKGVL